MSKVSLKKQLALVRKLRETPKYWVSSVNREMNGKSTPVKYKKSDGVMVGNKNSYLVLDSVREVS